MAQPVQIVIALAPAGPPAPRLLVVDGAGFQRIFDETRETKQANPAGPVGNDPKRPRTNQDKDHADDHPLTSAPAPDTDLAPSVVALAASADAASQSLQVEQLQKIAINAAKSDDPEQSTENGTLAGKSDDRTTKIAETAITKLAMPATLAPMQAGTIGQSRDIGEPAKPVPFSNVSQSYASAQTTSSESPATVDPGELQRRFGRLDPTENPTRIAAENRQKPNVFSRLGSDEKPVSEAADSPKTTCARLIHSNQTGTIHADNVQSVTTATAPASDAARLPKTAIPVFNDLSVTVIQDRHTTLLAMAATDFALPIMDKPAVSHHATAAASVVPQQVAQQLAGAIADQSGPVTEIALNPVELGRVRMQITAQDSVLTMQIVAERPETADLLRRHIDALAQEFRALGFQDLTFSFGGESAAHHGKDQPPVLPTTQPDLIAVSDTPAPIVRQAAGALDLRL